MLFVFISATLWMVLSLNEEDQRDLRMPLRMNNVPDSVTLISPGPGVLNVSLRAKGTQLIKMSWGNPPTVNIDFRAYGRDGMLRLSSADLKAAVRNSVSGAQVNFVYPDSLALPYTTRPGEKVPVNLDYKITTGPQSVLAGEPRLSSDSVSVFMGLGNSTEIHSLKTEPLRLTNIDHSVTYRVKVLGPANARIIPDSVDVSFEVEPLIFKNRKVVIEPVNVPENLKLITFPSQADVLYMIPMSSYSTSDPHFKVKADYRSIRPGSKMVRLELSDVPDYLHNVHLTVDSAEYIIERLR